MVVIKGQR